MSEQQQQQRFQEQLQKLQAWIATKCPNLACTSCGQKSWHFEGIVSGMPVVNGSITIGGSSTPVAQISCKNCFYTIFYTAVPVVGRETL